MPREWFREGPDSTPNSFLYDMSLGATEESIAVPSFAVSNESHKPHFIHTH
jgi:hypothetical protein